MVKLKQTYRVMGPLPVLSYLGGMVLATLKLLSTIVLVREVPPQAFPWVFSFAIFYLFLSEKLFERIEERRPDFFHALSFSLPVFFFSLSHLFNSDSSLPVTVANYLLTLTTISLLDSGLKHLQSKSFSLLSSSKEKLRPLIAEEFGQLSGSLLLVLSSETLTKIVPSVFLAAIFFMSSKEIKHRLRFFDGGNDASKDPGGNLKFYVLIFLTMLVSLKLSYGILLYEGFKDLEQAGVNFGNVFLYFSAAQSFLSLLVLLWKQTKDTKWESGIWHYLIPQIPLLLLAVLTWNPWLAIFIGNLRKTFNHTYLNESFQKLAQFTDSKIFSNNRRKAEKLGHILGMGVILAMLNLTTIFQTKLFVPMLLCLQVFTATMFFLLLKKHLKTHLITELADAMSAKAIRSILLIGTNGSKEYETALQAILKKTQSPHLKVLVIETLGKIPGNNSEELIWQEYNKSSREDLKVACVKALRQSRNYQKYFIEELELVGLEHDTYEGFRQKLFQEICLLMPGRSLERLLQLLSASSFDQTNNGKGNLLHLIGDLAGTEYDLPETLLENFLRIDQIRRVRTNAIVALLKWHPMQGNAEAALIGLKNSSDELDQLAWVYAQGELQRKSSVEEILEISRKFQNLKMTCHLALLKLGEPSAGAMTATLYEKLSEEKRMEFIHQLSNVMEQKHRLVFYDALIQKSESLALDFIEKLTYSKRDFGNDPSLILLAFTDKGIKMPERKIKRLAHYG